MASPLSVVRNDYHKNRKSSTIYTPPGVARFLFDILAPVLRGSGDFKSVGPFTVFDPAIGSGRLTDPWYDADCHVIGCDPVDQGARCHECDECRFEDMNKWCWPPDLVLLNPPFNGAPGKRLYPEVFLERIFEFFGPKIPAAVVVPMGFRLNQRRKSSRWKWLRDSGAEITSIVSLPLDIFPDVEFHCEILIFNVPGIKPHYFLPSEAL